MRRVIRTLVVLILAASAVGRAQTAGAPPDISLADYLGHLDRLRGAIERLDERKPGEVAFVLSTMPRAWTVVTEDHRMDVSADWLRRDLMAWRVTPDAATRARIVARIAAVRTDAAAFAAPARDVSGDRTRLATVLAAREFAGLHGPTWFDRLRQRALQWFIGLLGRMLGSSAIPTITNVVVYGLIALVVVIAALGTYRSLTRSAALDTVVPDGLPASARSWMAWLDDARAAAAENRWPEAIHYAYWCGVALLEGQGAWRPDRSRTPREYLRLLAASHEHRPALQALTRHIEHVWYGTAPADRTRFDDALAELKRLGCPSL